MTVQLDDGIVLPRASVRFPVELRRSPRMRADDPATWPRVEGRLEYVGGKLLYMPPCADYQQDVASDVTYVLRAWRESHTDFVVGSNEAGMLLGGEVRGADAAVWRAEHAAQRTGKLRHVPPLLAVEVAGEDEGEEELRDKARWYLDHGVAVVWLLFPRAFQVVVISPTGESLHGLGASLPEHGELPDLAPPVERLFAQLTSS